MHIDTEFKALIPPLQQEEYQQLEINILKDGCQSPLIVWNDILIDGHNRYEVCTKHNLTYATISIELDDRNAAIEWIINNQFGRRNLPAYERTKLALRLEEVYKQRGKVNMAEGCQNSDKVDTKKEIAKKANVSHDTVMRVRKIEEVAAPEVKEALSKGEVSINEVYTEIKKAEKIEARKELIEAQKADIESGSLKAPEGIFDVLVFDPPWAYGREYNPEGSRVANPYPEMTQQQLLELDIPVGDNAVIFLWTTHQFIFDAKELLDEWGFQYKATMVWNKEKIGMGAWLRMQCEFCLIGIRGKPYWENTTHRDIITEGRREHSRKPEAFYEMVEAVTAGRKLDYFSRQKREGWEVFGNDTEKF